MKRFTPVLACFILLCLPPCLIWLHHFFVSGLNPFLGPVFTLLGVLIAIPVGVWLFRTLRSPRTGRPVIEPATWFAMGAAVLLIYAFLSQIFLGNSAIDIHLHDTYFVISHGFAIGGSAGWFALMAFIYFAVARLFKLRLNDALAYIHFWVTFLIVEFIYTPVHYEGLAGMPRRYTSYSTWNAYHQVSGIDTTYLLLTITLILAQLLLPINLLLTLSGRRRATPAAPPHTPGT